MKVRSGVRVPVVAVTTARQDQADHVVRIRRLPFANAVASDDVVRRACDRAEVGDERRVVAQGAEGS